MIDLLYLDQTGGWQLIDWKTEWALQDKVEAIVQEHLLQITVYTQAIQQTPWDAGGSRPLFYGSEYKNLFVSRRKIGSCLGRSHFNGMLNAIGLT